MDNTILLLHCEDFTDSSLTPKTITNNSVTSVGGGKFKNCLSFNNGNHLFINDAFKSKELSEFTMDAWICTNSSTTQHAILSKDGIAGRYYPSIGVNVANETLRIFVTTGNIGSVNANNSLQIDYVGIKANTWYHVALVATSDNTVILFVNGNEVHRSKITFKIGSNTDTNTLYIGKEESGTSGFFDGKLDELRISNVARWTSNFDVPTAEYSNKPKISILSKTSSSLNFSVEYINTINRVDVFVNNIKLKTYTSNYENLLFDIDTNNSAYVKGDNAIKISVIYDTDKSIYENITHNIPILSNASLKEVMDEFEKISLIDLSKIDIVARNELPSIVKENQIVAITQYTPKNITVGNTIPNNSNDYDLYVNIVEEGYIFSTSGKSKFNVVVFGVEQFVDGTYKKIESYIGIDGKWKPMNELQIFNYGDECNSVTGGYKYYKDSIYGSGATSGLNGDHIRIYFSSSSYYGRESYAETKSTIDLSKYKRLVIECTYKTRNSNSGVHIMNGGNAIATLNLPYTNDNINKSTHTLDLSNINNLCKIRFRITQNNNNGEEYINIFKCWLE